MQAQFPNPCPDGVCGGGHLCILTRLAGSGGEEAGGRGGAGGSHTTVYRYIIAKVKKFFLRMRWVSDYFEMNGGNAHLL